VRQEETNSFFTQRFENIAGRLDALEVQNDSNKETFAGLEDRLASVETAQSAQGEQLDALGGDLEGMQSALSELQSGQASLGDDVAALQTAFGDLRELRADLEDASQTIDDNAQAIEELTLEMQSVGDGWQAMLNEFQMLKAMELLTRSRVNLTQGNLSLARSDIEDARELLIALQDQVSTDQAIYLEEVIARLDAAIEDLPRSSIAAADEVEGAWQLLLEGLPVEPEPEETP
jgi:chromosome segregation ATPase